MILVTPSPLQSLSSCWETRRCRRTRWRTHSCLRRRQLVEAIKQKDQPTLNEMIGKEAFAVTPGGGRQTGMQMLRILNEVAISSYRISDVKAVNVSKDVGILTYRFTWSGTRNGVMVPETTVLATSTWARRDGEWTSVFYQETPVSDGDDSQQGVKDAAADFLVALNELFTGDVEPMKRGLVPRERASAYMGPAGGIQVGWDQVRANWEAQAALNLKGKVKCEYMQVTAGPVIGIAQCRIVGENFVDGKPRKVSIRTTSTFRQDDGQWKMIGHHTDLLPFLQK